MFGVLLAGGSGSRLWPITSAVSKQLLPIFNKPMVYYSLSTLMLAGVRDVLVVVNPHDLESYKRLLGDGSSLGISIEFAVQPQPLGIPHALDLVPRAKRQSRVMLMLGDNLFFGANVGTSLSIRPAEGALAFGVKVPNPSEFGVAELDSTGKPLRLVEKPKHFISDIAIPGVYFLDETVYDRISFLSPSSRGELEITQLLESYLRDNLLKIEVLPRGTAWLDTGKASSLARASQFVEAIEENQGLLVGSPHEVAWRQGWVSDLEFRVNVESIPSSDYGQKLKRLVGQAQG